MEMQSRVFRAFWTLLSIVSAFPIWASAAVSYAMNGDTLSTRSFLFVSSASFLGLFAGFWSTSSQKKTSSWITFGSAAAIVVLVLIYAVGSFTREPSVPWNQQVSLGFGTGLMVPLIVIYAFALNCCLVEALLHYPRSSAPESNSIGRNI